MHISSSDHRQFRLDVCLHPKIYTALRNIQLAFTKFNVKIKITEYDAEMLLLPQRPQFYVKMVFD